MSLLQEALDACGALTRRVEYLEYDKVAQALEITKLKRRVKKLEKGNKSMSAKRTLWNEFSSSMVSSIICLSTEKGFFGVETPLFEGMLVEQEIEEEEDAKEVTAGDDAHRDVSAAHGDVSAAHREVPTVTQEPSIPSPTPPTPPPKPP
nr:hypothetical protein [Tanacetum cinerariifolium]